MIVVTGGAGFIGANLVQALSEQYDGRIVVCDRMGCDDRWENLLESNFYHLLPPEQLLEFLDANCNDIECIVHLGAISATTEKNVALLMENNYGYSVLLWDWCVRNKKRLIYASSAATYGDGSLGFDDSSNIEQYRPLNPYGWSKHTFDLRVLQDAKQTRTPEQWVGLKFFNVFGQYEHHKGDMMSVICKLYPKIASGEPISLFKSHKHGIGDGEQKRDFVYVKDCVDVILWFLDNKSHSGIFNLGTGEARSFLDLVNCIYNACHKEPRIDFIPMPENLRSRYQYFTEAKMDKLRGIGYTKPFTSLQHAIQQYVDYLEKYYIEN